MSLLEFPIRRYQITMVAFLCLVALGWFSFTSVPREEDPYFKIPGATITAVYPGADPKDLEQLVVKPIEDRLAELDDVHKMETTVNDSRSFTYIEFNADTDADKKFDEVTREINALRPELPPELQKIEVRKVSPGLVNTLQVALVSADAPYRELEDYARSLKDALTTVDGVRTAESWAFPARELRVQLDLQRMAELALKPPQVIQALQSENANIQAGSLDVGPRSFSLKTLGSYRSLDEVRDHRVWLIRIVWNIVLDRKRRAKTRPETDDVEELVRVLPANGLSAEQRAAAAQHHAHVLACVAHHARKTTSKRSAQQQHRVVARAQLRPKAAADPSPANRVDHELAQPAVEGIGQRQRLRVEIG